MSYIRLVFPMVAIPLAIAGCGDSEEAMPVDPATADRAQIDRFSASSGNLFVRDPTNGLPGPNAAIDFDQPPFITQGLGPAGEVVQYYNFDVMPTAPAPIFVLFREGEDSPVPGQLNIIDVVPGDAGYSDFWQVNKVTVPADYVANTAVSGADITEAGFAIETTGALVNCPVVPDGSTATKRIGGGSAGLFEGWYRGKVISYFSFEEKQLTAGASGVPLSPIFVTFNVNPDQPGGGPPSGFVVEDGTVQTHNVVGTLPQDEDYSPLWLVNAYDNADFDSVSDLNSAQAATLLGAGIANVNCPIVSITP